MPLEPRGWERLAREFNSSLDEELNQVRERLRTLIHEACREVGSLESSILLPAEDSEHLRFFVSVNETLEREAPMVPIADSLVGYVFQSGQVVAVDKPRDYYKGVDRLTGTETREYLAIPLFHEARPLGVQTFVNRPAGGPGGPFDPEQIQIGQNHAALAAALLRYHERLAFLHRMTRHELEVDRLGGPPIGELPRIGGGDGFPLFMEMVRKLESLSPSDLAWINELIDVGVRRLHRTEFGDLEF